MEELLIFLILILIHRRIELAFLSFLPYLAARMLLIGAMSWSGIVFYEGYAPVFPYLIALGVLYSAFATISLVKYNRQGKEKRNFLKVSLISYLCTTLLGLGFILFINTKEITWFAGAMAGYFYMTITLSCFVTPALFRFLLYRKGEKRLIPVTFFSFLKYLFFILLFFTVSVTGLFLGALLFVIPIKVSFKKELMHYLIYYSFKLIRVGMIDSHQKMIDFDKKIFDKPGILICNRQTALDVFFMLTLSPKVILLTNKKVWEKRRLARIAKMCDFYPVTGNPDMYLSELEAKLEEGYSILIFPEKEPGKGFTVNPFEETAFYLAGKLRCRIAPVLAQGSGHYLQNGIFQLKQGYITFRFYQPFDWDDPVFGSNPVERTRNWEQFYQKEMESLLDNYYRDPKIYKAQLLGNYLYKGALIEWFAKTWLRIESNFSFINQTIPLKGKIADMGCGYGMMSYLLGMTYPEREITGIDLDEEKIKFANACTGKTDNVSFTVGNILDFIPDTYDAIILSDIIHYLPYKQHEPVISKCISRVHPDGVVVIQESNKEHYRKHRGSVLFELMILLSGINKAKYRNICFVGKSEILNIASKHFVDLQILDNTTFISNTLYIIKKK